MPFNLSRSTRSSAERSAHEDDAELLLPPDDQKHYKRAQRVKHSVSYLFVTCAASFVLVVTFWLGPGLVPHDLRGISKQMQAPVGFSADNTTEAHSSLPSSNASSTTDNPTKAASQTKPKTQAVLPHHSWNPLLNDPAPITHVQVKPCVFPPWSFLSLCTPSQTAREVALYGKWVRVPRDLSKGVGHYYTEIYYRRAQTLDTEQLGVRPVTALRVWEDDEVETPEVKAEIDRDGWEPAGTDLRTGIWPNKVKPARLWLSRSTNVGGKSPVQPINEINVIWGDVSQVKPWWGFERIPGKPVFDQNNEMDHIRCDIVVRRGFPEKPPTPELTFKPDGKFRILQISDLHFSSNGGDCHSASLLPTCAKDGADASTMAFLSSAIDQNKPDLVVLTGDQIRGRGSTFDTLSTITKFGHIFADKGIPWTAVFGNHDHDKALAIEEQMYVMKHMPYFLGQAGPGVPGFPEENSPPGKADMGVGNYVLQVKASKTDSTQALTLYFLDSHSCPPMTLSQIWNMAMGGPMEVDWLKESQIFWYRNQSHFQPSLMRPYRPATYPLPMTENRTLRKPNALMFFHIPLIEGYLETDKNPKTGGEMVYGNQREGRLTAEKGVGFFERGVLNTTDGSSETEVKVILNGHAHVTDTCRRHEGVWHCMSGISSYSGKALEDWERRVRVVDIEDWGETISTFLFKDGRATSISKDKTESSQTGKLVLYGHAADAKLRV